MFDGCASVLFYLASLLRKMFVVLWPMRNTAGFPSVTTNIIDLYNVTTKAWSTAVLSVARWYLAATSVGDVAIFAGGWTSGTLHRTGVYDRRGVR